MTGKEFEKLMSLDIDYSSKIIVEYIIEYGQSPFLEKPPIPEEIVKQRLAKLKRKHKLTKLKNIIDGTR